MGELCLIIREDGRDWSGAVHISWARYAIAALSADPLTLAELEASTTRFARLGPLQSHFAHLTPTLHAEPYDAGLVVIDLVARLVVVDSTHLSAGPEEFVCYYDGQSSTETQLPYHLADDWLFIRNSDNWHAVAESRRQARATRVVPDARAILYGWPLLEYIARETATAFTQHDAIAAAVQSRSPSPDSSCQDPFASPFYDTIKDIHAAWLLTPRDDLGGAPPRAVLLASRHRLDGDLQDRSEHWSRQGECPRGLDESSHAFRFGGFGTHELVTYYDLVRELLWSCWEQLTEIEQAERILEQPATFTLEEFVAIEVPRLERIRDEWFVTPDPELGMRTPLSIIDRERARLPEGGRADGMLGEPGRADCQAAADLPGVCFWHLDGSGMDDGFAFDLVHATREAWEQAELRREERNLRTTAEFEQVYPASAASAHAFDNGHAASQVSGDSTECLATVVSPLPLGIRVFDIGCQLAELIANLREESNQESTSPQTQPLIDQLNQQLANLRELLQTPERLLAPALFDPVIQQFADSLVNVALVRPDLARKCESLKTGLVGLLHQPTVGPVE